MGALNVNLFLWILFFVTIFEKISSYTVFYAEEECRRNGTAIFHLGRGNGNSTAILKASRGGKHLPDMNCHITLKPPLSSAIVISIRRLDLLPPVNCPNYLELNSSSDLRVRLCGYLYDNMESQSFFSLGDTDLIFHTENASASKTLQFEIVFTVLSEVTQKCRNEEVLCGNGRCIWKRLKNDGHNNCGDLSDEGPIHVSQENQLSAGMTLAVIIPIIVLSLGLILLLACCFGNRVTAKIERLIQNEERRTALVNANLSSRQRNYNTTGGPGDTGRHTSANAPVRREGANAVPYVLPQQRTIPVPERQATNFAARYVARDAIKDTQLPSYEPPPSYESATLEMKPKY